MLHHDTLSQVTQQHVRQRQEEGDVQRLALEARGRRQRARRRFVPTLSRLFAAQRHAVSH